MLATVKQYWGIFLIWGGIFVAILLIVWGEIGAGQVSFTIIGGIFLLLVLLPVSAFHYRTLHRAVSEKARHTVDDSYRQVEQFLEAMPVGAFVLDPDLNLCYVNQRGKEIFDIYEEPPPAGLTLDEVVARFSLFKTGTDQVYPYQQLPYLQVFQQISVHINDLELARQEERIPLEVWAEPIYDTGGNIIYAVAVFQDITERRQSELALQTYYQNLQELVSRRTSELATVNEQLQRDVFRRLQAEDTVKKQNKFLNIVIESLADPFYVINTDDYTIEIANSAARQQGIPEANTCYGLTHHRETPCDGADHPCPLARVKKHKEPFVTEHIHRLPDGTLSNIEVRGFPIFNEQGDVVQLIEYTLDITGRKQSEEKLRKLSRAVAQSGNAIVITDLKADIEFVNPAFSTITGYAADEVLGKNPRILKSNQNPPELYQEMWRALVNGEVWQGELINRKKTGEHYWEFATISPVKDKDQTPTHYLAVKEDITQRKRAEEELQRRNRQLALINHASQIFGSTLKLDEVIQIILGEMHRLLNIVATSYWLRNPKTGELVCRQASGPGNDIIIGVRLAPGEGLSGKAAESGKPLIVPDIFAEDEHISEISERTGLQLRSMLTMPLRVKGEVIGVLNLADTAVGRFTEEDISLIEPIAAVAASAIKNAQLFNEIQQQHKMAESLRQVSLALNSSLHQKEVVPRILGQLRNVIQYDSAGLFLREDKDLILTSGANLDDQIIGFRIPLTSKIRTARVFRSGQPLITPDVREDPYWNVTSDQILSWMAAPLLAGNESIGVLTMDSYQLNSYGPEDAQVLQTFANHAAIAIENARLFKAKQDALERTETLYSASLALSVSLELQQIFKLILTELHAVVPFDGASVHELKGSYMETIGGIGFLNLSEIVGQKFDIYTNNFAGVIMHRKEPVILEDIYNYAGFNTGPHSQTQSRAWMGVPLLFGKRVIGALCVDKKEVGFYTGEHAQMIMAFAAQAAIAIENARLLNEEQQQRQVAEQRTTELSLALSQLTATQNQLVVQEKMASLGMLTAGIAHEIKNPLNFVTSFAQLSIELSHELQEILDQQKLDAKIRKEINETMRHLQYNAASINEEGQRANSIVQSMLLHSRGGTAVDRQQTDLNVLLQEAVNLAFHSLRAKDIDFDISISTDYDPAIEPINVVPQNLSRVFVNLINNAYYATREKQAANKTSFEARLEISTRKLANTVEICIRDNGVGIPLEKKDKLFTPFFTTKPAGEGTGLGLSISYDIIVQEHQGNISVDTQDGEYTEFIIDLPVTQIDSSWR